MPTLKQKGLFANNLLVCNGSLKKKVSLSDVADDPTRNLELDGNQSPEIKSY